MHFYSLPEIEALLACTGLEIEGCYGSFDLTPLTTDSSNIIIVARNIAHKETRG